MTIKWTRDRRFLGFERPGSALYYAGDPFNDYYASIKRDRKEWAVRVSCERERVATIDATTLKQAKAFVVEFYGDKFAEQD